jgi:hypothetical protein
LVDRAGRTFEQNMIAAGSGRNLEPLFDQGQVLVKIAIELCSQTIVFKSEFELRCECVVGGR